MRPLSRGELRARARDVLAGAALTGILAGIGARIDGWTCLAVWVVLVPFLLSLERVRSLRVAAIAGLLASVLFTLGALGWFTGAITSYTGASAPLAVAILLATGPLLEPQLVTVAVARTWVRRRGAGRVHAALLAASVYVGTEWASGKLFGDTLAHGLHPAPAIRQFADLAGASGLTFAAVLANECIVAALARAREPAPFVARLKAAAAPLAVLGMLLLALVVYGRGRLESLARGDREPLLTAAAIQAGVSDYPRLRAELGTYDAVRLILDAHFDLSVRALASSAEPVDLLVWPETVYPTTYGAAKSEDGAAFDREIESFVDERGVPLVFGTYARVGEMDFNAAAFLEPRGDGAALVGAYLKQRLFPFTERVPAYLDFDTVRRLLPWLGTWRPGTGPPVIEAPLRSGRRLRVAPLVCYDAVDPDLAAAAAEQGAELLLVLSNDSWFAHGGGPHGHLIVSAYRSVETGLPQVRATNTGISALIDASGEILTSLDTGERGALVGAIPAGARERPWAVALVPFTGPASLVLAFILFVGAGRPRR